MRALTSSDVTVGPHAAAHELAPYGLRPTWLGRNRALKCILVPEYDTYARRCSLGPQAASRRFKPRMPFGRVGRHKRHNSHQVARCTTVGARPKDGRCCPLERRHLLKKTWRWDFRGHQARQGLLETMAHMLPHHAMKRIFFGKGVQVSPSCPSEAMWSPVFTRHPSPKTFQPKSMVPSDDFDSRCGRGGQRCDTSVDCLMSDLCGASSLRPRRTRSAELSCAPPRCVFCLCV